MEEEKRNLIDEIKYRINSTVNGKYWLTESDNFENLVVRGTDDGVLPIYILNHGYWEYVTFIPMSRVYSMDYTEEEVGHYIIQVTDHIKFHEITPHEGMYNYQMVTVHPLAYNALKKLLQLEKCSNALTGEEEYAISALVRDIEHYGEIDKKDEK